ncbi:GntR family transcriptional regulator [Lutispora thermophila]|uniref:DNA-binding transcriptional regulator, GntR family n=1 Tax=Lutispora thermophila DSM 19022 TaxID=1122184 RepID=A0A1M6GCD5_9FIRM|nr:GntR family transcriptional regulator [Lutispora thermophila]SHJ07580.1 DNA-binding transcriptional regulator, GntR family [Lutispora thermophila DSM 19022]
MIEVIKTTLADQIYTILRDDIISQRIKCGEKLTLKALQERFDISSTPIREAIKRLSQEGLVEHVTNVGAKVIDIKEKDIIEIYDFCSVLDSAALEYAMRSSEFDELVYELENCIKSQEISLNINDMTSFKLHSDNFHDILYKYADNSRLYDAARNIRSQFTILTNKYQNYINAETNVLTEHKELLEAIKSKDVEKASSIMARHFEHAKNYLLKALEEGN